MDNNDSSQISLLEKVQGNRKYKALLEKYSRKNGGVGSSFFTDWDIWYHELHGMLEKMEKELSSPRYGVQCEKNDSKRCKGDNLVSAYWLGWQLWAFDDDIHFCERYFKLPPEGDSSQVGFFAHEVWHVSVSPRSEVVSREGSSKLWKSISSLDPIQMLFEGSIENIIELNFREYLILKTQGVK
jgi:hypothetical protein